MNSLNAWKINLGCVLGFSIFLNSCGFKTPSLNVFETPPAEYRAPEFEVRELQGKKISEFTVVLFKQNFEPEQWRSVFERSKRMAMARIKIEQLTRAINDLAGGVSAQSIENRDRVIAIAPNCEKVTSEEFQSCLIDVKINLGIENAILLGELGESSGFLSQWREEAKVCSVASDALRFSCEPVEFEDPLATPMEQISDFKKVLPVLSDSVRVPYLTFTVENSNQYFKRITFKLRLERKENGELWFRGDAIPENSGEFFPVGYGELLFK